MAEKTILVCDRCGSDGAQRVQVVVDSRRLVIDLCSTHLTELTGAARPLRRARRATSPARKTVGRRPRAKASTSKRGSGPAGKGKVTGARTRATRSNANADVAGEVTRLRGEGLSYREVGEALLKRGIKPKRSARWNPIVLSRLVKNSAAA